MLSLPVATSPQGLGEIDFRAQPIPQARVSALRIEHDDLDCVIDALAAANTHDELVIARLKKRRLQIRDEIAGIVAAARMDGAPDAAVGATFFQINADSDAPAPQAMTRAASSEPGRGSFVVGAVVTLLVFLMLALGWSDLEDSVNQTLAQIYVLSLLAAANG